jgi:hypothetical protein
MNPPFFIEAWEGAELSHLQICRKVMAALFKRQIFPLPFASTMSDAVQVDRSVRGRGLKPAIFVVNTYLAEPLLIELDKLMGDTPVLLLRREVHAHHLIRKKDLASTTVIMKKMNGRPSMLCPYDQNNAPMVVEQVADCLARYLADEDFWHFARLSVLSISSSDL